jgi:hypothetical protein
MPNPYFRSKTQVWGGFAQFRCRTSPISKMVVGVHTNHEFWPSEPFLRFLQRTCPIHNFRPQTHVWGGFAQFRCRTSPIPKTGVGVQTNTSFPHRSHFFVFRNEHAHTLGPKLMFGVVSRNFVAAHHPFRKRVSGCIRSTSFCHRNHIFVFRNEHTQTTTLGPKLMFVWFRAISLPHVTHSENGCRGAYKALVFATGTNSSFFATNMPKPLILGPKLMFGVVSRNFGAARHAFQKRVSGYIQSTSFCHWNHFFVFRNEHAQSTTLGPKLMFGVVLRNFVAARQPFQKWVSGRIQTRVFANGTISLFLTTNMPNPLL